MKKTITVIIILLILGAGAYYFISYDKKNKVEINNPQITDIYTSDINTNISMKNIIFNPQTLNIKVGTKVTWVNDDNVAHTVTSDENGIFDSGTMSPGQSFSFTFTDAVSINYHCNIHRMMKGTIVVQK